MIAAQNGHSNVVETLLQHGASVDMQSVVSTSENLEIWWDAEVVHPWHVIYGLHSPGRTNNIQWVKKFVYYMSNHPYFRAP